MQKQDKFVTDELLRRIVSNAFNESMGSLNEAGLFDAPAKKGGGEKKPEKKKADLEPEKKAAEKPKEKAPAESEKKEKPKEPAEKEDTTGKKEPEKLKSPSEIPKPENVSFDMIVHQLNSLRSGRSMKDRDISNEMMKYFNRLAKEEQTALWTFLNGMSNILAGTMAGDVATTPKDSGDIEIVRSKGKKSSDAPGQQTQQAEKQPVQAQQLTPGQQLAVKTATGKVGSTGAEDTMAPVKVVKKR